jgi:ketosteroid isomerase-like protein
MDAGSAARAWADTWSRAWPARDADAIADLYAPGAAYRSHPFRQPMAGRSGAREYALSVFGEEEDIKCWFGDPIVSGRRAAVEWWAAFRSGGKQWTLAGTSVLRFAADGKVAEHCDYWVMDEGHREPPSGWGR